MSLALIDSDGVVQERIPRELLLEAKKALDDETLLSRTLTEWLDTRGEVELSPENVWSTYQQLLDFSHLNRSELGLVGRVHSETRGQILDMEQVERRVRLVSVTTVLALALRRLLVLQRPGVKIVVPEGEG